MRTPAVTVIYIVKEKHAVTFMAGDRPVQTVEPPEGKSYLIMEEQLPLRPCLINREQHRIPNARSSENPHPVSCTPYKARDESLIRLSHSRT